MFTRESDYVCPRCSSHETRKLRPGYIAASGFVFMGLGAFVFFIPIAGVIFLAGGVCALVASPFLANTHLCRGCGNLWKAKEQKKIPAGRIICFMERAGKFRRGGRKGVPDESAGDGEE
ncbi:MAG: hypothetical protein JW881_08825 [Spirochaetales bacterium]|nr:hypothetical protein [Spirochaetales bacterium]